MNKITPKEKAEQLIQKAEGFIYTSNSCIADEDAEKNCANLVVDEILEVLRQNENDVNENLIQYWCEVKNELFHRSTY